MTCRTYIHTRLLATSQQLRQPWTSIRAQSLYVVKVKLAMTHSDAATIKAIDIARAREKRERQRWSGNAAKNTLSQDTLLQQQRDEGKLHGLKDKWRGRENGHLLTLCTTRKGCIMKITWKFITSSLLEVINSSIENFWKKLFTVE